MSYQFQSLGADFTAFRALEAERKARQAATAAKEPERQAQLAERQATRDAQVQQQAARAQELATGGGPSLMPIMISGVAVVLLILWMSRKKVE